MSPFDIGVLEWIVVILLDTLLAYDMKGSKGLEGDGDEEKQNEQAPVTSRAVLNRGERFTT